MPFAARGGENRGAPVPEEHTHDSGKHGFEQASQRSPPSAESALSTQERPAPKRKRAKMIAQFEFEKHESKYFGYIVYVVASAYSAPFSKLRGHLFSSRPTLSLWRIRNGQLQTGPLRNDRLKLRGSVKDRNWEDRREQAVQPWP